MTTTEALQALSQRREPRAWAVLVERHGAGLFRAARGILGDDALAEDACQETFLLLRAHAGRFRAREADPEARERQAGAWILRIGCNVALKLLRARRAERRREERRMREAAPEGCAQDAWAEALREELDRLPEAVRQPLVLRFYAGLEYGALGEALGCSPGAAKVRVHRGLERLRERLALLGLFLGSTTLAERMRAAAAGTKDPGPGQVQAWTELLDSSRSAAFADALPTPKGVSAMFKLGLGSVGVLALLAGLAGQPSKGEDRQLPPKDGGRSATGEAGAGDPDQVAKWITGLGAEAFEARDEAAQRLKAAGFPVLDALRAAEARADDPEVKARLVSIRSAILAAHPERALKLSLEPAQLVVDRSADTKVPVKVFLENTSGETLTVARCVDLWGRGGPRYVFTLTAPDGSAVKLADRQIPQIFLGAHWDDFIDLAAGARQEVFGHAGRGHRTVDLSEYVLPGPGVYKLAVSYDVSQGVNSTAYLGDEEQRQKLLARGLSVFRCKLASEPIELEVK
ncbi:MAG: sigma-70 family RNA polymerase sigma factor [Planctomycetota bacterium]|nr:sigma-70 family RNA polymerase sigma factor [Planctomycetota bacterium]